LRSAALKQILSKGSLKSDAIHPNAAGYVILAEAAAQLLRDSGALKRVVKFPLKNEYPYRRNN